MKEERKYRENDWIEEWREQTSGQDKEEEEESLTAIGKSGIINKTSRKKKERMFKVKRESIYGHGREEEEEEE